MKENKSSANWQFDRFNACYNKWINFLDEDRDENFPFFMTHPVISQYYTF